MSGAVLNGLDMNGSKNISVNRERFQFLSPFWTTLEKTWMAMRATH